MITLYKNIEAFDGGSIVFYKNGRFENNNELNTVQVTGPGYNDRIYRSAGTGTYYIKYFILVLMYSDGKVFTRGLTGLKSVNPQQDNSILSFGEVAFYKK